MEETQRQIAAFDHPDVEAVAIIRGRVLHALQTFLLDRDFRQLLPILMSPITAPVNHVVYPAEIQYQQRRLKLTTSMIFHKQLAPTSTVRRGPCSWSIRNLTASARTNSPGGRGSKTGCNREPRLPGPFHH